MPVVEGCPCGRRHELPPEVASGLRAAGPRGVVVASAGGRSWQVPAVFVAAHGLRAAWLPELAARYGFAEIPAVYPAGGRRPQRRGRHRR